MAPRTATTSPPPLTFHIYAPLEDISGGGSGRSLPGGILLSASLCAVFATLFSCWTIWQHLKNYRKPALQRYVVRLLVM